MTEEARARKAEYVKSYRLANPDRVAEWRQRELERRRCDSHRRKARVYMRKYISMRGQEWARTVARKSHLRRRIISNFEVSEGQLYEALMLVGNFRHSYRKSHRR